MIVLLPFFICSLFLQTSDAASRRVWKRDEDKVKYAKCSMNYRPAISSAVEEREATYLKKQIVRETGVSYTTVYLVHITNAQLTVFGQKFAMDKLRRMLQDKTIILTTTRGQIIRVGNLRVQPTTYGKIAEAVKNPNSVATDAPRPWSPKPGDPTLAPTDPPTRPPPTRKPVTRPAATPPAPTDEPLVTEGPTESVTELLETEGPTEAVVTEEPTEETATEAATEESPTEGPTEETATEEPTDAPTETPTEETVTESATEESATEEGPTEAATEETVTEGPTEAVVTEGPTEAAVTEGPTELPAAATTPQAGLPVLPAVPPAGGLLGGLGGLGSGLTG